MPNPINSSAAGKPSIFIVGNGMVGHALCEVLAGLGVGKTHRVVIFGDEPRPAYDRVNLTSYFKSRSRDALELSPANWYREHQFELFTDECVTRIIRDEKCITTSLGNKFRYDQLVLATGSRPFVPPIEGVDQAGVFLYRTIEDLKQIDAYASQSNSAAVLGGGLLGLEAARAMVEMGLQTHVVELAAALMPRQLDREGGDLLRKQIERLGVQIHLQKRTTGITQRGRQRVLQFDTGSPLAVEMIIISAGIRPRDELARSCGLKVGPRGGFSVDRQLRTSDPNVFAIGECASHNGRLYGLVGPGYQMANVLARNLVGEATQFDQADQSARLKLMGVSVVSLGIPLGEAEAVRTSRYQGEDVYRMVTTRKNRLVGALAVGEWPELEQVRSAIDSSQRVRPWQFLRFKKSGRLWKQGSAPSVCDWPEAATVCSCLGITRGQLSAAADAGNDSIDSLVAVTKASTVCGSCRQLLAELVGASGQFTIRGWRSLLAASLIACAAILLILLIGPSQGAPSVQSTWHIIDLLLQDFTWKQATGYSLLGLSLVAMLLPVRKRLRLSIPGELGLWRALHGVIGVTTLLALVAHTGLHLGSNLNLVLAVVFLGINLVGAAAGIATSLETRMRGTAAIVLRRWRPRLTLLHILMLWPFPLLLAFHIASAYYF